MSELDDATPHQNQYTVRNEEKAIPRWNQYAFESGITLRAARWATDVLRPAANWHNREAFDLVGFSSAKNSKVGDLLSKLRLARVPQASAAYCDSLRTIPWDHACGRDLAERKDDA